MKKNTASRTAQYMALYRALESRRIAGKRLFSDPYAIHFLDPGLRLACRLAKWPPVEHLIYRFIQRRIPGSLASGIARTRYIDDLLETSLRQGAKQLIILGAGFDTRALRIAPCKKIPVIEIDHPDTARSKQKTLQRILPEIPRHIHWLQLDFDRQDPHDLLPRSGVDMTIPTTIIWEGVSNYLHQKAVDNIFSLTAKFPQNSSIIFTYIDQALLDNPSRYLGGLRLLKDLEKIEEKWTLGFRPEEMQGYCRRFGLTLRQDKGAAEYRERYIPDRKNILAGYEFYRVAWARR